MFVMLGAVIVTFIGFRLVLKWPRPVLAHAFHLPTKTDFDLRVIVGPAIFGVGWGIVGFCPGPALVALGYGSSQSIQFVIAMLVGMAAARALANRQPAFTGSLYE
jgi:uncharacterized membrane protein YedE/YeeE